MSNDSAPGPISQYGDLSRRARRELEAKGINPDEALAAYNQTGNIEALTGSIPIIVSQPAVVVVEEPVVEEPAVDDVSEPVVVPSAPQMTPVPASSIFPEGLSRRDEATIEQRRTAEIPTLPTVDDESEDAEVEDSVVSATDDGAETEPVEEVEPVKEVELEVADDPDEEVEPEEVEAEEVEPEEVVPIDLEPVEVEAIRIDQRDDREEITNEFEPFTITTTSTGIIPTTSHALVLPTLPEDNPDVIAALNQTGEIVITGQITLPAGIASVGADAAALDTADIDLVLEDIDTGAGQDLAPVSAAQAVSSFSGTAINVTMPKRSSEKLPVILAIAAAALALGVVGLFVANYFLRVF